jgi:exosortase D (VPLPA-CTERM-specific)
VLVDNWGIEQAEGFLHDFEGWVVFMFSMVILIIEMWLFARFSKEKKPFQEVFGLEMPEPTPKDAVIKMRSVPGSLYISVGLLLIASVLAISLESRVKQEPERAQFTAFPSVIGEWEGRKELLGADVLEILKADDYIVADYRKNNELVNFYVAYYASQEAGSAAHSPKSCIPGGGWRINSLETVDVDGVEMAGQPLSVNRLVIRKGDYGQLVYYWFQQRNRIITNEYLVKWYLFIDALKDNRTDGAMVRLTTPLHPGEEPESADRRLVEFAKKIQPRMDQYIPR